MMYSLTPEFLKALAEKQKLSELPDAPALSEEGQSPATQTPDPSSPEKLPPSEMFKRRRSFASSKPPENGEYIKNRLTGKMAWRATYKDGKLHGFMMKYYPDGVALKKIIPYHEGVVEGVELTFERNGLLQSSIPYKAGKREGAAIGYNDEGRVISTSFYKNGKVEGPVEILSDSGELLAQINYKNGMLDGPYIEYEKGIPSKISLYQNDYLIQVQTFDEKGQLKETRKVQLPTLP